MKWRRRKDSEAKLVEDMGGTVDALRELAARLAAEAEQARKIADRLDDD